MRTQSFVAYACLYVVRYIFLITLLKCTAIYNSVTKSNKSATTISTCVKKSSDKDSNWRGLTFELFRTLTNFIISWTFLKFLEHVVNSSNLTIMDGDE